LGAARPRLSCSGRGLVFAWCRVCERISGMW
jgi:hypothetical protein